MKSTSRKLGETVAAGWLMLAIAGAAQAATMNVTVANTGSRDIDGIYLAASAQAGWGPDQIEADVLAQGESLMIRDVSCATSTIVVIAEDLAGCFSYQTVTCGTDATWTITSATPRDCGR